MMSVVVWFTVVKPPAVMGAEATVGGWCFEGSLRLGTVRMPQRDLARWPLARGEGALEASVVPMPLEIAIAWLAVRPGSCAAEVRQAFRRRVREIRPDLPDRVNGSVLPDLDAAREALCAAAGPDRRRAPRAGVEPHRTALCRRRATWGLEEPEPPVVDLRL